MTNNSEELEPVYDWGVTPNPEAVRRVMEANANELIAHVLRWVRPLIVVAVLSGGVALFAWALHEPRDSFTQNILVELAGGIFLFSTALGFLFLRLRVGRILRFYAAAYSVLLLVAAWHSAPVWQALFLELACGSFVIVAFELWIQDFVAKLDKGIASLLIQAERLRRSVVQ